MGIVGFLLTGVVFGGFIYLAADQLVNKSTKDACSKTGKSITVTIKDDTFSETQINGQLCDTLTITNNDDKVRNIAFGVHDKHQPYDGVTEKLLKKDGSFTVTLNETGTFEVHDHLEEKTEATFTVTK